MAVIKNGVAFAGKKKKRSSPERGTAQAYSRSRRRSPAGEASNKMRVAMGEQPVGEKSTTRPWTTGTKHRGYLANKRNRERWPSDEERERRAIDHQKATQDLLFRKKSPSNQMKRKKRMTKKSNRVYV